jgi:predicted RNase H-like HicB family nuclease
LLKEAAAMAQRYRIVLERDEGAYLARAVEVPTVFASAGTPNECEAKIREMLTIAVATMMEMGDSPPLPASKRRVQVNIRLSGDEKMILEESAQQAGFRGVSEFVRFAALSFVRGSRQNGQGA